MIVGDFNACYRDDHNNKLIHGLLQMGFKQIIDKPTHIRGRIIDQIYMNDPSRLTFSVEKYSPYYTDHDALCISLTYPSRTKSVNR